MSTVKGKQRDDESGSEFESPLSSETETIASEDEATESDDERERDIDDDERVEQVDPNADAYSNTDGSALVQHQEFLDDANILPNLLPIYEMAGSNPLIRDDHVIHASKNMTSTDFVDLVVTLMAAMMNNGVALDNNYLQEFYAAFSQNFGPAFKLEAKRGLVDGLTDIWRRLRGTDTDKPTEDGDIAKGQGDGVIREADAFLKDIYVFPEGGVDNTALRNFDTIMYDCLFAVNNATNAFLMDKLTTLFPQPLTIPNTEDTFEDIELVYPVAMPCKFFLDDNLDYGDKQSIYDGPKRMGPMVAQRLQDALLRNWENGNRSEQWEEMPDDSDFNTYTVTSDSNKVGSRDVIKPNVHQDTFENLVTLDKDKKTIFITLRGGSLAHFFKPPLVKARIQMNGDQHQANPILFCHVLTKRPDLNQDGGGKNDGGEFYHHVTLTNIRKYSAMKYIYDKYTMSQTFVIPMDKQLEEQEMSDDSRTRFRRAFDYVLGKSQTDDSTTIFPYTNGVHLRWKADPPPENAEYKDFVRIDMLGVRSMAKLDYVNDLRFIE